MGHFNLPTSNWFCDYCGIEFFDDDGICSECGRKARRIPEDGEER